MKLTENQKEILLDHIVAIQYELGLLTRSLESSKNADSIGIILQRLSIIMEAIIHNGINEEEQQ